LWLRRLAPPRHDHADDDQRDDCKQHNQHDVGQSLAKAEVTRERGEANTGGQTSERAEPTVALGLGGRRCGGLTGTLGARRSLLTGGSTPVTLHGVGLLLTRVFAAAYAGRLCLTDRQRDGGNKGGHQSHQTGKFHDRRSPAIE
jgi:hypothetical protein